MQKFKHMCFAIIICLCIFCPHLFSAKNASASTNDEPAVNTEQQTIVRPDVYPVSVSKTLLIVIGSVSLAVCVFSIGGSVFLAKAKGGKNE